MASRGTIAEFSGVGKTELAVQLLSENPHLSAAWIEESFSLYPLAFLQRKVSLDKLLFVEGDNQCFWSALQILRSGLFQLVIITSSSYNEKTLRTLQLTAEKAQASVILLSTAPSSFWPISLKIQIQPPLNRESRPDALHQNFQHDPRCITILRSR